MPVAIGLRGTFVVRCRGQRPQPRVFDRPAHERPWHFREAISVTLTAERLIFKIVNHALGGQKTTEFFSKIQCAIALARYLGDLHEHLFGGGW